MISEPDSFLTYQFPKIIKRALINFKLQPHIPKKSSLIKYIMCNEAKLGNKSKRWSKRINIIEMVLQSSIFCNPYLVVPFLLVKLYP